MVGTSWWFICFCQEFRQVGANMGKYNWREPNVHVYDWLHNLWNWNSHLGSRGFPLVLQLCTVKQTKKSCDWIALLRFLQINGFHGWTPDAFSCLPTNTPVTVCHPGAWLPPPKSKSSQPSPPETRLRAPVWHMMAYHMLAYMPTTRLTQLWQSSFIGRWLDLRCIKTLLP